MRLLLIAFTAYTGVKKWNTRIKAILLINNQLYSAKTFPYALCLRSESFELVWLVFVTQFSR